MLVVIVIMEVIIVAMVISSDGDGIRNSDEGLSW